MDIELYFRFVAALALVLGLIAAIAWGLKRVGLGQVAGRFSGAGPKRLQVVETLSLDAKRRLVLVRRDDTEHLLLTGGGVDILVESGINAAVLRPEPQ